ncbi:hypothetical protein D3C72_1069990 [compost metagenome]
MAAQHQQRLHQGARLLGGGHDEGGLGRDLGRHVDGLARHHDEAAVVLLLVGELLGQHVQPVEFAACGAADGGRIRAPQLLHLHHGAGGGVADLVARPFQLAQIVGALLEHLGVGVEGLDAAKLGRHCGEDAVLYGVGQLTDDGEGGVLHHVVHLVDGARAGVLYGQHPEGGATRFYRVQHLAEVLAVHLDYLILVARQVLAGGQAGVRAARAQVGDAGHGLLLLGVEQALQIGLLGEHGVFDDGVVDAGDVLGVQPERAPFLDQGNQQILLPLGVADGTGIGLLGAGNLDAEGLALGQQGEQLLIQLGDVLSDLVERSHCGSLSKSSVVVAAKKSLRWGRLDSSLLSVDATTGPSLMRAG